MTLDEIKTILPSAVGQMVDGYYWSDSSGGYTQTSTFRLELQGKPSRFLKGAPKSHREELRSEKDKLKWLKEKLPVPEVLAFEEGHGNEFLLLSALPGLDASSLPNGNSSPGVVRLLAAGLRMVHEVPIDQCPFDMSLKVELEMVRFNVVKGFVDEANFESYHQGKSAEDLFDGSRPVKWCKSASSC